SSSLYNLVKALDERLEKGITSTGSEIFSSIDHIISEYLTSYILSAKRVEMAQYLYFDAMLTNLRVIDSYNE
ncbi:29747_t:CDS:2, partial [Gigaspora margarita]